MGMTFLHVGRFLIVTQISSYVSCCILISESELGYEEKFF